MKSVTEDSTMFEDGQEVNSEPWAEQMDEPEPSPDVNEDLHVEDSAEEFEIPETLKQLISFSGLCFVAVPEGTWNVDGYSAKVRRGFSVIFSFDDELSSSDIVEAFMEAGVDVECIFNSVILTVPGVLLLLTICLKRKFWRRAWLSLEVFLFSSVMPSSKRLLLKFMKPHLKCPIQC